MLILLISLAIEHVYEKGPMGNGFPFLQQLTGLQPEVHLLFGEPGKQGRFSMILDNL
jgi:hypothetical protein